MPNLVLPPLLAVLQLLLLLLLLALTFQLKTVSATSTNRAHPWIDDAVHVENIDASQFHVNPILPMYMQSQLDGTWWMMGRTRRKWEEGNQTVIPSSSSEESVETPADNEYHHSHTSTTERHVHADSRLLLWYIVVPITGLYLCIVCMTVLGCLRRRKWSFGRLPWTNAGGYGSNHQQQIPPQLRDSSIRDVWV